MMLDIIENTRHRLVPFLGLLSDLPVAAPSPVGIMKPLSVPLPSPNRIVRRIPEENYGKLPDFSPIGWL